MLNASIPDPDKNDKGQQYSGSIMSAQLSVAISEPQYARLGSPLMVIFVPGSTAELLLNVILAMLLSPGRSLEKEISLIMNVGSDMAAKVPTSSLDFV